jgi:hypothetical protein
MPVGWFAAIDGGLGALLNRAKTGAIVGLILGIGLALMALR